MIIQAALQNVVAFAIMALPSFCLARKAVYGIAGACATIAIFVVPAFFTAKHLDPDFALVPEVVAALFFAWTASVCFKISWRLIRQRNKRA